MWEVTYPVYTLALLGVKTLVITNACGGIDRTLSPGDLMLLSDHINMLGINSLIGPNDERFGPRLPDMTEVYSRRLREKAHAAAASLGFQCKEGVYAIFSGPCYETAAEIRAYAHLGPMPSACPPCRRPSPPAIWAWRCWVSPASPTWPPASPEKSTPMRRCCVSPTRAAAGCAP